MGHRYNKRNKNIKNKIYILRRNCGNLFLFLFCFFFFCNLSAVTNEKSEEPNIVKQTPPGPSSGSTTQDDSSLKHEQKAENSTNDGGELLVAD